MRHNDVLHLRNTITLNLGERPGLAHALWALRALDLLGFGTLTHSTDSNGTKVLWFTKRPTADWGHGTLQKSRAALQLPEDFIFFLDA